MVSARDDVELINALANENTVAEPSCRRGRTITQRLLQPWSEGDDTLV